MKPPMGVHQNIQSRAYHSWDAVSAGSLKALARSPMHLSWSRYHPPVGPALILGQAYHDRVLLPDKFQSTWMVMPKMDRRTKAGKAQYAEFQERLGKTLAQELSPEDAELVESINTAVYADPVAGDMLRDEGQNEISMVWVDRHTGLTCKCRPDAIRTIDGQSSVIDLKGTKDASPRGFAREAVRYGYHLQAIHYLAGAKACLNGSRQFVFIAVEKQPPFAVGVYRMRGEDLIAMQPRYCELLRQYQDCEEQGIWPSYTTSMQDLDLPAWATGRGDE